MFDNLKQPDLNTNNPNPNPSSNPNPATDKAVDDIFAETEAPSVNAMSGTGNDIEAQPAGLAAQPYEGDDNDKHAGKFKFKTVIIIVLAFLIISALIYFVYAKFLSNPAANNEVNSALTDSVPAKQVSNAPVVDNSANNGSFVEPSDNTNFVIPGDVSVDPSSSEELIMPDEVVEPIEPIVPIVTAPVDSDADSLTDAEENILGTNINLIDSDFDGLSDYEEVRMYSTDPLNADTDGDGYEDGEEVEGGYDPNGVGVL